MISPKNIKIEIICIVSAITLFTNSYSGQKSIQNELPAAVPEIRFASVPAIVEAPSHIAFHNGYFKEEGLNLTMEINPDGKTSLAHLFDDRADIAGVMGTPAVYSSFLRNDFYIIGKMDHANIHWAVARKDSGILSPETVKDKRVAVMIGTSGHFYMDTWLIYNGLKPSDVIIFDMNGPDAVKAIQKGDVDAMFYWFPFPQLAEQSLGKNAVVLPSYNFVPGSWVIVAKKSFVLQYPETAKRFLRAIERAEKFLQRSPEAAIKIHAGVSGIDEALIAPVFNQMNFRLSMDHTLLLDLEDQARWIISYGYTDQKTVPNYLEYLYPDALKAVKPEAVTIITGAADDH